MLNVGEMSGLSCCGITIPLAVESAFLGLANAFALKVTFFPSFKALPLFALAWFFGSWLPSPAPGSSAPSSGSAVPAAAAAAINSSLVLISSRISPIRRISSMASVNSWPENAWAFFPRSAARFLSSFLESFINSSLVIAMFSFLTPSPGHVLHGK